MEMATNNKTFPIGKRYVGCGGGGNWGVGARFNSCPVSCGMSVGLYRTVCTSIHPFALNSDWSWRPLIDAKEQAVIPFDY